MTDFIVLVLYFKSNRHRAAAYARQGFGLDRIQFCVDRVTDKDRFYELPFFHFAEGNDRPIHETGLPREARSDGQT